MPSNQLNQLLVLYSTAIEH